jgi:uncharacterized protein
LKDLRQELDQATLLLNLWLTQGVILTIAASSSLLVHGWQSTLALFARPSMAGMAWSMLVAAFIIALSIIMERYLPLRWQDDGSINELLFGKLSPLLTILVCLVVGIGEEWLFRGVIQPFAGIFWTSVIFTLVHIRYLRKPLLVVSVFLTSWLLGELFAAEGSLWLPIAAHVVIDMMLAFYLQYMIRRRKGEEE